MRAIGNTIWAIPEGYLPSSSKGDESHETVCILNTSDQDAEVEIMIYFKDREPVGPYNLKVPARRTLHQWFNKLRDPEPIPLETDYSSVITSNVPVVVQHTRLDSRHNANALITTIAHPITDSNKSETRFRLN